MSFLNITRELKRILNEARQSEDEAVLATAEMTIHEFVKQLESEQSATLKVEYSNQLEIYQLELTALRKKKRMLQSTKNRKAEELLMKLEQTRNFYTRAQELELEGLGIWESMDGHWDLRPPTQLLRKMFRSDIGSSTQASSRVRHGTLSSEGLKDTVTQAYKNILRNTRSSKFEMRTEALRGFDPDTAPWSEAKELGSGAHGRLYAIVVDDSKIEDDSSAVFVVKEVRYSTRPQKFVMQNECKLLEKGGEFIHTVGLATHRFWQGIGRIFMEYISGGDLNTLVRYVGPIAEMEGKPLARQLLSGLSFLHKRSIVHRDLKSANILISLQGCVKITDFSCAWDFSGTEREDQTGIGEVDTHQGTILWTSPESARKQELQTNVPCSTDIWSFGCIYVEMLTGIPPWPHYHTTESDLVNKLSLMGLNDHPVEGPPLGNARTSADTKRVLDSIFTTSSSRPSADTLLGDSWLATAPYSTGSG